MACPETDGRHVHIDMLARSELPGVSNAEGDSDGIARERLDLSFRNTTADVVANEKIDPPEPLDGQAEDSGEEQLFLMR